MFFQAEGGNYFFLIQISGLQTKFTNQLIIPRIVPQDVVRGFDLELYGGESAHLESLVEPSESFIFLSKTSVKISTAVGVHRVGL